MLARMWHWRASEFEAGHQLLEAVRLRVPAAPRAYLHQLQRKGRVCCAGRPVADDITVSCGLPIAILASARFAELVEQSGIPPQALLYEDRHALVVAKPAGLATHRAAGHDDNLVARLARFVSLRQAAYLTAPVHRLDIGTSGAVLFGKGRWAVGQYGRLLMDGQIGKNYLALVSGRVPARGELISPVAAGGILKPALSRYRRLAVAGSLALLEIELVTGRQHQARRQLADAGWPIVGDRRYGGGARQGLDYPCLHCCRLHFPALDGGSTRRVVSPLPAALVQLLRDVGMPIEALAANNADILPPSTPDVRV
jgi:23S rRNA-/tRNA-specific pseudouridylate synthase